MNFIKKVFDGVKDEEVHLQFQKFSKGEFRDKALIEAKNAGGNYSIKTSSEFANEFVRFAAERLGDEKTKVTGAIVSTADLNGKIDFKEKKQFQGGKRYIIEKEMSGEEIISLLDKFPKNFFALSFNSKDSQLKIKPKAPKSAKPGKGDDAPKADFCNLKTSDAEFAKSFVFEKPDFKDAKIKHTFLINELILPQGEKDFAKIRELAIRKGKIIREAEIDRQKFKKEFEFEA